MKIAIIGAGNVGTGLTKHLVAAGHEVCLSFSKDMAQLRVTAGQLGASASTVAEAVANADIVVLCTPYGATAAALSQVGNVLAKKPLWDCTNALKADLSGLVIGTTTSAGEEVQKQAPWADVVKAIPPFAEVLHADRPTLQGGAIGVFTCGDNAAAKQIVAELLVTTLGVSVTDAGPLSNARYTEAAGFLLIQLAYVQGLGARIGLALVSDKAAVASENPAT
jgi:8-hydroxy-5-deazaflavin:NADPH oxidoreductase